MWLNNISDILGIALRTLIIYMFVFLGIRLLGKRDVGQMTPLDLVLLLLIANAVQNAMTGPDTTVVGGLAAAATLLVINALVTRLLWRHKKIRRLVEGTPTLLIRHGKLLTQNLTKENLSIDDLLQALREHGVATMEDVSLAVLEIDGSISVLKNDDLPTVARQHHRIRFLQKKP